MDEYKRWMATINHHVCLGAIENLGRVRERETKEREGRKDVREGGREHTKKKNLKCNCSCLKGSRACGRSFENEPRSLSLSSFTVTSQLVSALIHFTNNQSEGASDNQYSIQLSRLLFLPTLVMDKNARMLLLTVRPLCFFSFSTSIC